MPAFGVFLTHESTAKNLAVIRRMPDRAGNGRPEIVTPMSELPRRKKVDHASSRNVFAQRGRTDKVVVRPKTGPATEIVC